MDERTRERAEGGGRRGYDKNTLCIYIPFRPGAEEWWEGGAELREGLECLEHEEKEYMAQHMRVTYIKTPTLVVLMKKRNGDKDKPKAGENSKKSKQEDVRRLYKEHKKSIYTYTTSSDVYLYIPSECRKPKIESMCSLQRSLQTGGSCSKELRQREDTETNDWPSEQYAQPLLESMIYLARRQRIVVPARSTTSAA